MEEMVALAVVIAIVVGAWHAPKDLMSVGGYVSMKKPRAGAYHKYIKIKNIVHEEN